LSYWEIVGGSQECIGKLLARVGSVLGNYWWDWGINTQCRIHPDRGNLMGEWGVPVVFGA